MDGRKSEMSPAMLDMFPVPMSNVSFLPDVESLLGASVDRQLMYGTFTPTPTDIVGPDTAARSRYSDKTQSTVIKGSPYLITERRVSELIPVLGSQPAGDVNHRPGGRLPLLYARPAVTPATPKRPATNFAAW